MIENNPSKHVDTRIEMLADTINHAFSIQQKSGAISGFMAIREIIRAGRKGAILLHEVYSNAPTSLKATMTDVDLPARLEFFSKSENIIPHELFTESPIARTSLYYDRVYMSVSALKSEQTLQKFKMLCCETGEGDSLRFFQYIYNQPLESVTPVKTIRALDWMNRKYLINSTLQELYERHVMSRLY